MHGLLRLPAFALSLRQHPRTLDGDVLTLRFAQLREVGIPLDRLVTVGGRSRLGHKRTVEARNGELS